MVSDKFRRQLRQEAELWQAEGLIDTDLYEQLSERYQFNTLDTTARDRFVMILLGLGSVLIGLGIITFVAANWQELPRNGKVTLLLSLFIGVNTAGFYLWRQPKGAQHRLGHGLLLLGSLILGANMGLMGQMFHISGQFYELLLAWGIGVLAMAYSLRLTSLSVVAIIIIGLGYWGFWGDYVGQGWSETLAGEEFSWSSQMGQHMPLISGLMFVPLAYWCRSRAIFGLAAIAVISSLLANLYPLSWGWFSFRSTGLLLAIAFALPPALLWAYDDSLWVYGDFYSSNRQPQPLATTGSFQPLARSLSLAFLGVVLYLLSSFFFWRILSTDYSGDQPRNLNWLPLVDALILSGLAIFEWLRLAWLSRRIRDRFDSLITTIAIGIFISLVAAIPIWHLSFTPIPELATLIFNVLLFLFAGGLMRAGLAQGERQPFWGGMVLVTLRIVTWFVLIETGLVLKSLLFILCGVVVIAVGLWFERYVRTLSIKH